MSADVDTVQEAQRWCEQIGDPLWPGLTESDWAGAMRVVLDRLAAAEARANDAERAMAEYQNASWRDLRAQLAVAEAQLTALLMLLDDSDYLPSDREWSVIVAARAALAAVAPTEAKP